MTRVRNSKILCVILAIATIATLILPIGSFTAYATVDGDYEYVSFGGSAYIQKYNGTDENVEIPDTIGGNKVTTIDDYAFRGCESVKSIIVPSTVTRIDISAFEGCINLEAISIPGSVTYIGTKVFYNCQSLKAITIPSSVTYIGAEVFAGCASLTEINVDSKSSGYTSVDGVLFDKGKTRLMCFPAAKECESYIVPDTVQGINTNAFSGCSNIKSISLPNTPLYIYEYAFAGCTELESVHIPSNTVSIFGFAFDGCTSLKEFTVDANNGNYTAVDGVLFNKGKTCIIRYPSAKSDTAYTIPKTVTYIDYGGFADCTNLTSIKFHSSFYYFRNEAFRGCTGLTSITLPYSMTSVGSRTFEGCTSLESISISNQNIYYSSKGGVLFDKSKTYIHYYPQGKADTSYTLPDTVKTIDTRAFYGADNLTKLVIPNSVETIRENAFLGCDNLTIYAKAESYAYSYATNNGISVVANNIVRSISHRTENGKLIFTITTYAGNYTRIKLTTPDDLGGSLAVASTYTVNEDGNYVWTIKTEIPKASMEYTFDFRDGETGKYLKDYFNYYAEIVTNIKSVSYEKANGKVNFTVITSAGEFNRLKVTLGDNPKGYITYTNNYTVNENGDFVWKLSVNAPDGEQEYAFDLRSSTTRNYLKEYVYHMVTPTIKGVYCRKSGSTATFTIVTAPGNFDRVRCGTGTSTIGNIANANKYTVGYGGDYTWSFTIDKPSESITLYFDVRNADTGKFIKDYYIFEYVA